MNNNELKDYLILTKGRAVCLVLNTARYLLAEMEFDDEVFETTRKECEADIRNIKLKYGIKREFKWNTVSMAQYDLYKELIDYFFASEMEFRCVLVTYKDRLDHM